MAGLIDSASIQYMGATKDRLCSMILDKAASDTKDFKILDIGCNDAEVLLKIFNKRNNIEYYGLDIVVNEAWTEERYKQIHFIQGEALKLPFKDRSINLVIATEIIEHLAEVDVFFREAFRVLKQGGYFFISTPSRYNYISLVGKLVPKVYKDSLRRLVYYGYKEGSGIKEILQDGTVINEHVREYLPGELKGRLHRNGFVVESIAAGRLRVPLCPLFDSFPLLLKLWGFFDKALDCLPGTIYIKANFVMEIKKKELDLKNVREILVLNLGGIGDILLSLPSLKALRNLYPQARISFLGVNRVKDLLEDKSYVNDFYSLNMNYSKASFLHYFIVNFKILFMLRKRHFDLLVNMRTLVSKSSAGKVKLITDIINPKSKAGRNTDGRGDFFDISIPETSIGKKYEMEYDIDIVKALGAEVGDRYIELKVNEASGERVNALLAGFGVSGKDMVITVNPGGMPSRRWPVENFAKVIDGLNSKLSAAFVITGSKDESALAGKLKSLVKTKVIDLTGKMSVKELAALIKRSNCFITNDTGPMHIASILKIPLIAILGPGDITRYDPRVISDNAVVLHKKADCAPCNRVTCKSMKCLKVIQPEEVIEIALKLLTATPRE